MYDLIADIHGHADELVQLLEALGYQKARGSYRHPDRKVIFSRRLHRQGAADSAGA